jgi:hypothetical protein
VDLLSNQLPEIGFDVGLADLQLAELGELTVGEVEFALPDFAISPDFFDSATQENPLEKSARIGRPTVMTLSVLTKLKSAWRLGCTDVEAADFAEISPRTIYNFGKKQPDFFQWKEGLKLTPILKAKLTVYRNLNSPTVAQWFLERKAKGEFSTRAETTGTNGRATHPDNAPNGMGGWHDLMLILRGN